VQGIADTGLLVAFANRRDVHHAWAKRIAQEVAEPLLTCEAVLAEAAFHLRSSTTVLALVAAGLIVVRFELAANHARLTRLALRYADRAPDLADLCLICMSEENPKLPVITVDSDFLVYKRFSREVIPTLMPAKSKKRR
jgi:uncharacterized protein